jgi:hypothetical protein
MAVNARSLQNLKPWPKGVSGNPGGRTRRQTDDLIALIDERNAWRTISERWLAGILAGDVALLREFLDRSEGRVPQAVQSEGEVTVKVVRVDRSAPALKDSSDDGLG